MLYAIFCSANMLTVFSLCKKVNKNEFQLPNNTPPTKHKKFLAKYYNIVLKYSTSDSCVIMLSICMCAYVKVGMLEVIGGLQDMS